MPPAYRRIEARARRETLILLMQTKFGPIDPGILARIEQISDIAQLDRLHQAVLTAETVADMPFPVD